MPSQKRLIYILNSYSADDTSHFHHVIGLLEALADRGIDIALIIERATDLPAFRSNRIQVHALRANGRAARYRELYALVRRLGRAGYSRVFVRISAGAALVAVAATRGVDAKVYLWQSGTTLDFIKQQPWSPAKLRTLVTAHLPNYLARTVTDYFVTGPAAMIDYYVAVGGVRRDKVRLLYNDVDVALYSDRPDSSARSRTFRDRHAIDGDSAILLLVHRLSPVRRTLLYFPLLVQQLLERHGLQRFVVVVAGGGPELPAAIQQAAELGVERHCRFLGAVPNRLLPDIYRTADIFIHPTYNEGFPRVILEGMAAGLPIVSTNAGGTAELLGPMQQEFIVDRDRPDLFAERVAYLLSHPQTREALRKENLEWIQRFSTPRVAAMYDQVLFS